MPKMKTHSGASKRFKKTASGKILRRKAGSNHLFYNKGKKTTRDTRKGAVVHKSDAKRMEQMITYL
jgi:large subunit ribosomal protein L35